MSSEIDHFKFEIAKLEAKLIEARSVIFFYGCEDHWQKPLLDRELDSPKTLIEQDNGQTARDYLGEGTTIGELPCDVFIPPNTIIRAGCDFITFILAIGLRQKGLDERSLKESDLILNKNKARKSVKKTYRRDNEHEDKN